MADKLIFGRGNAKLSKDIYTFSLPAGHSCPSAKLCYSKADKVTGKLRDGKHLRFRCFAASQEAVFTNVRKSRWHNFNLLRNKKEAEMIELISSSLPEQASVIRIHVSGDFFNEQYLRAWIGVAKKHPDIIFYSYTKSLKYWVKNRPIPHNLKLNASAGGMEDSLIDEYKLKYAKVVFSEEEAEKLGLRIDHTDEMAYGQDRSFALLLHGQQPAGSEAAEAIKQLKKKGVKFAYGKKD
jgi:hypothetical protein